MSNCELLAFYSEQRHIIQHSLAVNRNIAGYFKTFHPVGKYGLKCLTKSVMLSPGQYKIIDYKLFHINPRISVANVIY